MMLLVTHFVKILHFANEKPNISMVLCRDAAIMCNVQLNYKYECSYLKIKPASSYRITKENNDYKCIAESH